MYKRPTGRTVVEESLRRMIDVYEEPYGRPIVAFSGGKDATVVLELAIEAARRTGRLPVEVAFRDRELQLPGTYEYVERAAQRTKEVKIVSHSGVQFVENVLDRECPYWWTYDPLFRGKWMREPFTPPAGRVDRDGLVMRYLISPEVYPLYPIPSMPCDCEHCGFTKTVPVPPPINDLGHRPPETIVRCARCRKTFPVEWPEGGQDYDGELFAVYGHRVSEATTRRMALASRKSFVGLSKDYNGAVYDCWPIYDWKDADVWKFISERKLDHNSAYDALLRAGVRRQLIRTSSQTVSMTAVSQLKVAARIWPEWGEKVAARIDGVRAALTTEAHHPSPRKGETWGSLYKRTCLRNAPEWIREFSQAVVRHYRNQHSKHGSWEDFPDTKPCPRCSPNDSGAWRSLVIRGYAGFPLVFSIPKYSLPGAASFRPILEKRHGKAS